jgi:hypothetical protein
MSIHLSETEGCSFIKRTIASLHPGQFSQTVRLRFRDQVHIADVYGVMNRYGGWYIKFYVNRGQLIVLS